MRIPPIRAVTVCVDYADIASLTLPTVLPHVAELWIVTTPEDELTRNLAQRLGCQVHVTREFYHRGAEFAKWRALEMALDSIGRHGWMLLLDADICWPSNAGGLLERWSHDLTIGNLYGANRRMWTGIRDGCTVKELPSEKTWRYLPLHHNVGEWAGFTQLFHANDPVLPEGHWHDTNWRSCGAADSFFQKLWPADKKIKLPFEVLHVGEAGENWYGRSSPYLDGRPRHPEAEERKRKYESLWAERRVSGFTKERIDP
jgi:hypothetical protein